MNEKVNFTDIFTSEEISLFHHLGVYCPKEIKNISIEDLSKMSIKLNAENNNFSETGNSITDALLIILKRAKEKNLQII